MSSCKRQEIAAQLVEKYPSFAPGWGEHASHISDPGECLQAIEKGLAARPDRDTRGFLTINKAIAIKKAGDAAGALAMLRQLASDAGTSAGTRAAAEVALATFSSDTSASNRD